MPPPPATPHDAPRRFAGAAAALAWLPPAAGSRYRPAAICYSSSVPMLQERLRVTPSAAERRSFRQHGAAVEHGRQAACALASGDLATYFLCENVDEWRCTGWRRTGSMPPIPSCHVYCVPSALPLPYLLLARCACLRFSARGSHGAFLLPRACCCTAPSRCRRFAWHAPFLNSFRSRADHRRMFGLSRRLAGVNMRTWLRGGGKAVGDAALAEGLLAASRISYPVNCAPCGRSSRAPRGARRPLALADAATAPLRLLPSQHPC